MNKFPAKLHLDLSNLISSWWTWWAPKSRYRYVQIYRYILGASEITANLHCNCVDLYWEGCVICSIILVLCRIIPSGSVPYRYRTQTSFLWTALIVLLNSVHMLYKMQYKILKTQSAISLSLSVTRQTVILKISNFWRGHSMSPTVQTGGTWSTRKWSGKAQRWRT